MKASIKSESESDGYWIVRNLAERENLIKVSLEIVQIIMVGRA